jgi:hypothetical protein
VAVAIAGGIVGPGGHRWMKLGKTLVSITYYKSEMADDDVALDDLDEDERKTHGN